MQLRIYVKFKRNAKVGTKIILKNNFCTKKVNLRKKKFIFNVKYYLIKT